MSLWIPVSLIAVFMVFTIVRAVRSGRREAARLNRVIGDLENRRCPACARVYGPVQPDQPYATFIPDPGLDDPAYETYWQIRCPACDHRAVAGLPRNTEVMEMLPPDEGEKIAQYHDSLPPLFRRS